MTTQTATAQQWNSGRRRRLVWALTIASVGAALALLALGNRPAAADGAWLAQRPLANWNAAGAAIPLAPPRAEPIFPCPPLGRGPQTDEDRQVAAAGWTLVSAFQGGYGLMVVTGAATADGMCRPHSFQTFVFFLGNFIGTLSPELMDSRSDGVQGDVILSAPLNDSPGPEGLPSLTASFFRFTTTDPSCCPSLTASLTYTPVHTTAGWVLTPGAVMTTRNR